MAANSQLGIPWVGWYVILILSLKTMIACRVLVFLCYLFSGFFLYGILKTIQEISVQERLFLSIFFVLFPVNSAKIALCVSHYAISYFLFFLGFFLLAEYFRKKDVYLRILALALLFVSFMSLQSLLVFYLIVIIYIGYMERANVKNVKGFFMRVFKYMDFLVTPLVFWAIKLVFFKPYGAYTGYNAVSWDKLIGAIYKLDEAFELAFLAPLRGAYGVIGPNYLVIIIATLLISAILYKGWSINREQEGMADFWFLLFGVFAFVTGVFGYLAVDRVPVYWDWNSRFQMLVPLGAGFIIVYLGRIFLTSKARVLLYSLLVVLFIYANYTVYMKFQQDWFKQLSIVENLKKEEIMKNNTTFLFTDRAPKFNANDRQYRFYEYTGLMKLAFGNETRFGSANQQDFIPEALTHFITQGQFNCRDYKITKPQYQVYIDWSGWSGYNLTDLETIELVWLKFTKPNEFAEKIQKFMVLDIVKL